MKLFSKKFQKRIVVREFFHAKKFKALVILFACLGLLLCLIAAFSILEHTQQTIELERAKLANQDEILFEKIPHQPHFNPFVSFLQNTQNIRTVEKFQDSYFAATDGGLLQLTKEGKLIRHFTVLDGLPESDLLSLAVFGSELFIGTNTKGLVSFDGKNFSGFQLKDHETQGITDLMADDRRLLIGTFAGGLLEFDGKHFREIKTQDGKRIEGVNCLDRDQDSRLYVGTFADGLWVAENGNWNQFTTENGLLSNRVAGIERIGKQLFVGTDLGVMKTNLSDLSHPSGKLFYQSADLPTLSGLVKKNDEILLTQDDGSIFTLKDAQNLLTSSSLTPIDWKKPKNLTNFRPLAVDDKIWFVGTGGIWQTPADISGHLLPTPFGDLTNRSMPTSNVVSALTLDANSRLWVGNFRRGIDIFSAKGKKLEHLETEVLKEINFLGPIDKGVLAATSKGAVRFENDLKSSLLSREGELPSNSITHISQKSSTKNSAEVFSTGKGLWLKEGSVSRGFSTLNGLPSNTISTTFFTPNSLLVGTLGGMAVIENGKVSRVYKGSNSPLKNNWVTSFCPTGSRIFAGTYGGGIYELLPSGELRSFENETGKVFVNPNAMFSNGEKLFVGTLRGALVLDLKTEKWTRITEVLPSEVVLSINGNAENVFFGTTGGIARINQKFWRSV